MLLLFFQGYGILRAGPGQKISCGLALTGRAGRFLVRSGRAGLQKCWPVSSLIYTSSRTRWYQ